MLDNYNKEKILNLLDVSNTKSIYSIMGRMESLILLFEKHPQLSGINPFLKTYYFVTRRVSKMSLEDEHEFEDVDALEKLDIIFAGEFFNALSALIQGKTDLRPWHKYFEYCLSFNTDPFVKMLLGINAHINGDLAISLNKVNYQSRIDYNKINDVLLKTIPEVMQDLMIHDHDFFGLGGFVFKRYTEHEFEKIIVKWRNNAWDDYKNQNENVYDNAEEKSQQIIDVFQTSEANFFDVKSKISALERI